MDSNHNKQIQNAREGNAGCAEWAFFGSFVSVCFRLKGRISMCVGVTWVSAF